MGRKLLVKKYPLQSTRVAWRSLGDEVVIITPDDSVFFSLNPTGSFIWQHATGRKTLEEIAAALCQEFEASPQTAAADTAEFVQSLCEKNLLQLVDQPNGEEGRG